MPEPLILTIDLGTTRLKVAAFNLEGELRGMVTRRNRELLDGDSTYQAADHWWQGAITATSSLMTESRLQGTQIVGCSLSGRAGAAIFLDQKGKVLADAWSDTRHADMLKALLADRGNDRNARYGPTLLAKAMWLRQEDPDRFRRTRHILYAKDFLLYRMTGQAVTDPSSGPDGDWDASLLAASGIERRLLPTPALPWTIAGHITINAAKALGIPAGTPVAVGAHDGVCANTGAGATEPGEFAITLGTHAVVRGIAAEYPATANRFYGYPPDLSAIGANALWAGRAVDWFLDNWFDAPEEKRQDLYDQLDQKLDSIAPGAGGITFLPFLQGRISPERRPGARAAFHGMGMKSTRQDMYRSVLEGSSFAVADAFDQVAGWIGKPTHVGVTGSGARSRPWMQMLADILDQSLVLTDGACEGRGAAIFCAVALGHYPSCRVATKHMVTPTAIVEPNRERVQTYAALRQQWQRLVDATRALET